MLTFFKRYKRLIAVIVPVVCVLTLAAGLLPPVRERISGRVGTWSAQFDYWLNPPEEVIFIPQEQQDQVAQAVNATLRALTPQPTQTPTPASTPLPTVEGPTLTPLPTSTPTPTPTPLPASARITGIKYQHQHGLWNYCGPAILGLAVAFWGWPVDGLDVGAYLRGGLERSDDKNVMPYEMQNYVETQTNLRMIVRAGGNLDLLKALIAAGYPVILEKDDVIDGVGWLGHYLLLYGYDDAKQEFVSMDTYHGEGTRYGYDFIVGSWRAFNYTFLLPYSAAEEQTVLGILGPYADEGWANQHALEIASAEAVTLTGRDQFFAWFNQGSSHVSLLEYADAALAFDTAFSLYAALPAKERPWRMMWYQTGPYWAYYYTGRYQDVVDLANTTLKAMKDPILEESFYWRGLGEEALGQRDAAIADLQKSVKLNPNFAPGWNQLQRMQGGG